jgi:hypothetical protein
MDGRRDLPGLRAMPAPKGPAVGDGRGGLIGKSLTEEIRACIFSKLWRMKRMELMFRFYTGGYFCFYYFFSKGLPGAR